MTGLTGYARRPVLWEGSLLLTFSQLPLITLPKLQSRRNRKQQGTQRHSISVLPTMLLWAVHLGAAYESTSSTTRQHPRHVIFLFCFACVCLCMRVLYVCALHRRDMSVSTQVQVGTQARTLNVRR